MYRLLMILLCAVCWAQETTLPADAAKALETYKAEIAKIDQERLLKAQKASESALKALTRAQETATKRGKLEDALAIKTELDKLNESMQELAKELMGLLPRQRTWLDGAEWQIVWSGSRNFVKFSDDGTCTRQDGATGKFSVSSEGLATIVWDDGREWTASEPPKSSPDKTSGRNHAGTTFSMSRER